MADLFRGEPEPYEVTVTAGVEDAREDGWIIRATLENGTDAEGGEVELRVTESARCTYGLEACVEEFERYLNTILGREYRLDAALAMGEHGTFTVVASVETGPYVIPPPVSASEDLAA